MLLIGVGHVEATVVSNGCQVAIPCLALFDAKNLRLGFGSPSASLNARTGSNGSGPPIPESTTLLPCLSCHFGGGEFMKLCELTLGLWR